MTTWVASPLEIYQYIYFTLYMHYFISVRATLHPDAPAALELSIARTRVLDYL